MARKKIIKMLWGNVEDKLNLKSEILAKMSKKNENEMCDLINCLNTIHKNNNEQENNLDIEITKVFFDDVRHCINDKIRELPTKKRELSRIREKFILNKKEINKKEISKNDKIKEVKENSCALLEEIEKLDIKYNPISFMDNQIELMCLYDLLYESYSDQRIDQKRVIRFIERYGLTPDQMRLEAINKCMKARKPYMQSKEFGCSTYNQNNRSVPIITRNGSRGQNIIASQRY